MKILRQITKVALVILLVFAVFYPVYTGADDDTPVSMETEICLSCHVMSTPGIVADWRTSMHSKVSLESALQKDTHSRRISIDSMPADFADTVVGCAECHMLNTDSHKDSFEHNGYTIQVVVSPDDCATCHPEERSQYADNVMSLAYNNLMNNPVYKDLVNHVNQVELQTDSQIEITESDACLHCHGTIIEVKGIENKETSMGDMDFPVLKGWPSVGVGRINPDGSKGACTSCHPRHGFRIEVARSPETCAECHKGPDVPAYKVYKVSKHGNIYGSIGMKEWDFHNVPWKVGEDFTAPTCATCHVSKLATPDGDIVIERTHQMSDRAAYRLFGPIFAVPHPKGSSTNPIKSPSGLPIPADLDGALATDYLIDADEMKVRNDRMKSICRSCHAVDWVEGHFAKLDNSVETTNKVMLETNGVLIDAWTSGLANGLDKDDSIFNESIERMWIEQWLFYANSVRFASAMGGADLGVFANGRWQMSKNLQDMKEWVELHKKVME